MAYVVHYIHKLGLKVGIYLPAGMEIGKEGDNTTGQDLSEVIAGAPQCTLADAIYPDQRTTNGWNSSYALDFDNGTGCAKAYVDSLVGLFQSWGGVDLLKLDGAGPGSGHSDISGTNSRYDNRPEIAEYDRAFQATGRHVEFQGSWNLSIDYASDWQKYLDTWRTSNDVECYCDTLTTWSSIASRLPNALEWAPYAGPTTGWSNLDSLEVGNGSLDGLSDTERQTAMTVWSMAAAPLYLGDDLTQLDSYGLSLITNRDALAIDQDRLGATLQQVANTGSSYAVARKLATGDIAVALVNLGDQASTISTDVGSVVSATGASWRSRSAYAMTDVWQHTTRQTTGTISTSVPAHGSVLLRVSDAPGAERRAPSATLGLATGSSTLAPGGTTTATLTLTNTSRIPLTREELSLSAPQGWTVTRTGDSRSTVLPSGATRTVIYRVTAPATATDPISTATLTAGADYGARTGTGRAATPADVTVVSPVSSDYGTANTTDAPAVFGQLGNRLAISAAGSNVGPASQSPFGSTAGGDAYGAIYRAGALTANGTATVTVTAQSGGTAAKAGLIARNDADANGTPVGVALYVANGQIGLVDNNTSTGATTYTSQLGGRSGPGNGSSVSLPVTLRLVRTDTSGYTGSYSTDGGTTWTTLGTVTVAGQNAAQDVGVFQSAGSSTPALAQFTGLTIG
jgi:hypothetical protein